MSFGERVLVAVAGVVPACVLVRFVVPAAVRRASRLIQELIASAATLALLPECAASARARRHQGRPGPALYQYGSVVAAGAGGVLRGVDRALEAVARRCRSAPPVVVGVLLIAPLVLLAAIG